MRRSGPRSPLRPFARALSAALALLALAAGAAATPPAWRRFAQAANLPASPAAPVAYDAEVQNADGGSTLLIRLSRPVDVSAFLLERPDRVIVDLPEVNFQLRDDAGAKSSGLIRSFRFGLFSAGKSRIVIDLAQPASADARVETIGEQRYASLLIKLARIDRASFARAAREPLRTASIAPPAAPPAPDPRPLLVIDPGHGGVDPGARARNGMYEKTIVFDVARALKEKLVATGRYRVSMTRDDDVFVSLADRVKFARRSQADLMISLHADALTGDDGVRGASIYTGSDKASDAYAARLAESENRSDSAAGADTATELIDDVNDILSDLTRRETRAFSHRFAQALAGGLGAALPMHKTPLKSAGFRVLMAPDVPSVLIELGYLTNARDITVLTSPEGRAKAGDAILASIDAYFARRGRP
ncbi:N-acetylmuramoyl-L-alanine amidase [Terrarubrum flagellatum]|uniref:N-acetylmuramoyl-L-alanine amidase n=1 Tax=Terrirubrum flagellatum TaxID=2895980 RepID=UPI003144E95A